MFVLIDAWWLIMIMIMEDDDNDDDDDNGEDYDDYDLWLVVDDCAYAENCYDGWLMMIDDWWLMIDNW